MSNSSNVDSNNNTIEQKNNNPQEMNNSQDNTHNNSNSNKVPTLSPSPESVYLSLLRLSDLIFKQIHSTHSITDLQLQTLHYLFPKFYFGLELYENNAVKLIFCEETREYVFHVTSTENSSNKYTTLFKGFNGYITNWHYCTCSDFQQSVISQNNAIYCKHQLAARLAYAMGNKTLLSVYQMEKSEYDAINLTGQTSSYKYQNNSIANMNSTPAVHNKPYSNSSIVPPTPYTPMIRPDPSIAGLSTPILVPHSSQNFINSNSTVISNNPPYTPILQTRR